jgi:hypothetical protein
MQKTNEFGEPVPKDKGQSYQQNQGRWGSAIAFIGPNAEIKHGRPFKYIMDEFGVVIAKEHKKFLSKNKKAKPTTLMGSTTKF